MPAWLRLTILATILFGIYPIFGQKAIRVHGPRANMFIQAGVQLIYFIFFLIFFRKDLELITRASFSNAFLAALFSCSGLIIMFYSFQLVPTKLAIIILTIGFATVITAIISNFTGTRLTPSQWFWASGATICIAGLNWSSK